jgi:hypothetical protein
MAIFLYRLETDEDGRVLNHEAAEERVRQFIEWQDFGGDEPEPPFGKEELGIN